MRLIALAVALSSVAAQYNYRVCAYRGYNLPDSDWFPWPAQHLNRPDSYVRLMLMSNTNNVRAAASLARTHITDALVNHQSPLNFLANCAV